MKEVAAYAKPGMTVVDVGAGNGRFIEAFAKYVRYRGFEPSDALREAAVQNMREGASIQDRALPHLDVDSDVADVTNVYRRFSSPTKGSAPRFNARTFAHHQAGRGHLYERVECSR